jgi:hypothetical protein
LTKRFRILFRNPLSNNCRFQIPCSAAGQTQPRLPTTSKFAVLQTTKPNHRSPPPQNVLYCSRPNPTTAPHHLKICCPAADQTQPLLPTTSKSAVLQPTKPNRCSPLPQNLLSCSRPNPIAAPQHLEIRCLAAGQIQPLLRGHLEIRCLAAGQIQPLSHSA